MIKIDQAYSSREFNVDILDEDALKTCLLKTGYFPEANIFPPILEIEIKESGASNNEKSSPVVLFVPKSKQQWRDFKIVRPENYVSFVNQVTSRMEKIKQLYCSAEKLISFSVPFTFAEQRYRTGKQISNWHRMQEQLLSTSSKERLPILLSLDIQSCYHTLYTHTLEWAMETVGAKRVGAKLDESIRRGNDNRTHGLAVGQYTSDVAAEIVLSWVDKDIEQRLIDMNCAGVRYKDNYYFLCKSESDADVVLSSVAQSLRSAHFTLNDAKTECLPFIEYYSNRWQAEYDLLLASIQFYSKGFKFNNRTLKVFIEQTVLLSNKYNNQKGILDKAIHLVTETKFEGYINYKWLFYSVANMLPLRSLSYPKLLVFLKRIVSENQSELSEIYESFMNAEIDRATKINDLFALMWLGYVLHDCSVESLRTAIFDELNLRSNENLYVNELVKYMQKIEGDYILWPDNKSCLEFKHKEYMSLKELNDFLGVSFSES